VIGPGGDPPGPSARFAAAGYLRAERLRGRVQ